MFPPGRFIFWLGLLAVVAVAGAGAQPGHLILPTRNDALFDDDGPGFYQYTDRYVNGRRTRPWQGGQYGFVRNVVETAHGSVYTRFHEGVDVKPVYRDAAGEPLDTVRAIDDGIVAYVNAVEKHSNYGKYVVVEHRWGASPYYSLYAHLNRVHVRIGQAVRQGDPLGRLGYTGVGINRRRAHVHFEINLLLNRTFQPWYDDYFEDDDPNYHGIYSGLNMEGIDVPRFYLALRADSTLTVPAFLAQEEAFFQVTVPADGLLNLLWRYPWLSPSANPWTMLYSDVERPTAWTIWLARSGLPLRVEPSDAAVDEPQVQVLRESPIAYRLLTSGLLDGSGSDYALSKRGLRYVDLLTRTTQLPVRRVEW